MNINNNPSDPLSKAEITLRIDKSRTFKTGWIVTMKAALPGYTSTSESFPVLLTEELPDATSN